MTDFECVSLDTLKINPLPVWVQRLTSTLETERTTRHLTRLSATDRLGTERRTTRQAASNETGHGGPTDTDRSQPATGSPGGYDRPPKQSPGPDTNRSETGTDPDETVSVGRTETQADPTRRSLRMLKARCEAAARSARLRLTGPRRKPKQSRSGCRAAERRTRRRGR
jgi:hypothetical protein